jgi:L-alanine-DL-glutamate epimerase-like enolase superfamily enzyme
VADELTIVDGKIPLPRKPGLGIEVDMKALRKFEVKA